MPLSAAQVLDALFAQSQGGAHNIAQDIVWQLRVPRALAAFVCGALLAGSGMILGAIYMLMLYWRSFFGAPRGHEKASEADQGRMRLCDAQGFLP